jgi:chromosomal replication initiator protein
MIRFDKMNEFKERYRNVDLLLIDDIQFLSGKERTQEEFFHTFNALYEGGRQIVMTSDCAPRDIPTLEDRLRSRFEWGLITDIQPPDLETKIAILDKKSAAMGVDLPSDAALYIASKIKSNVRELEGRPQPGLRLLVRRARAHLGRARPEDPEGHLHGRAFRRHGGVHPEGRRRPLQAQGRAAQVQEQHEADRASAQIAMYLCKSLTDKSLPEVGRRFGGKHHSTVIHAIKKIEQKRLHEQDFDKLIHRFIEMVQ